MKIVITEKMFYKVYPCKARIKLDTCPHEKEIIKVPMFPLYSMNPLNKGQLKEKAVNTGLSDDTLSKIYQIENLTNGDSKVTCKTVKTSDGDNYLMEVYVKNEEILNKLIEEFNVYEIHKPFSENHETLLSDEKIIVRKNLFWNTFRYKIHLDWLHTFNMDPSDRFEMMDFIKNGFEYKSKSSLETYSKVIYLENEEDVILFKMSYGEKIHSIEKVITYDEV